MDDRMHRRPPAAPLPYPEPLWALLAEARSLGFLGPGPLDRHLANAQGFAVALGEVDVFTGSSPRVLDLGSGGGLPGLVLAACWPDARFTLFDAGKRRVEFLEHAVETLDDGDRIEVIRGRAEELGREPVRRGAYDLVVARSFGPPAITAECASPLLRIGGLLVTSEPPPPDLGYDHDLTDGSDLEGRGSSGTEGVVAGKVDEPIRWPASGLARLGMGPVVPRPVTVAVGLPLPPPSMVTVQGPVDATSGSPGSGHSVFHFQVLRQESQCPDRYPRRVGVPAKRPLF